MSRFKRYDSLGEIQYEVIDTAHDGQDAILKVQNHENIDLVITDVRMPNMDGLQLTSFIRKNYPGYSNDSG